jgi:predicted NBD/HSP70 family sugar kinase
MSGVMHLFKRDKKVNVTRILNALWVHRGISRVDISRLVDLDKSTVTKIVNELVDQGLIRVVAEGSSGPQGGRKPVLLTIEGSYGCVVGLELQPESCHICVVNLLGDIIHKERFEVQLTSPNALAKAATEIIHNITEEMGAKGIRVLGAGVGLPGIINPFLSVIQESLSFKVNYPFHFKTLVSENIDCPVIIDNDAKCCAWGKLTIHREKKIKDFISVLIELGDEPQSKKIQDHDLSVGFGLVIDGKVHYGKNYSSGEFKSLEWKEGNNNQFSLTVDEVARLRHDDDLKIRFVRELGDHIALLSNMFNLTQVYIGGHVGPFKELLLDYMPKALRFNWSYREPPECTISFMELEDYVVSFGAAGLVLNCMFAETNMKSHDGAVLPDGVDFLIDERLLGGLG